MSFQGAGYINAVREKHPNAYIIACLELHTFSSLNPAFLPQYRGALAEADVKILYYSPHTLSIKKLPDLSSSQLASYFDEPMLMIATSAAELENLFCEGRIQRQFTRMSSGGLMGWIYMPPSKYLRELRNGSEGKYHSVQAMHKFDILSAANLEQGWAITDRLCLPIS
jgi:hypothetical protein